MPYALVWTEKSLKILRKLPRDTADRIVTSVERITERPFDHIQWLRGSPDFRYRVGTYRVILDIKRKILIVYVISPGNRENVYNNL
jgi:mRNA interferase RelE/StbE